MSSESSIHALAAEIVMADLYVGIAILMLVSAGMLALGVLLGRQTNRRRAGLLLMLALAALLAYQRFVADRIWIVRVLPFSNAIILSDLYAPLVSLMAGLAWTLMKGKWVRRWLLLTPLVILSWWIVAEQVLAHPPELLNRWSRGVCIQTSNASCTAAAAATLLRYYGYNTDESEMAELCLTREKGTSGLGLYRGLKLKTKAAGWFTVPVKGSLEELQKNLTGPVILNVELKVGDPHTPYFEQLNWDPGMRHTVVLFRFLPNGQALMGDPSVGRERWSVEDLRVLWHGEGLQLVRK